MKDQITISISTIKGSSHWHLSKWMKRSLRSFLLIVTIVVVGIFVEVNYLYDVVDHEKEKQAELVNESKSLTGQLESLRDLKQDLEQDLSEREDRLTTVSDRLTDLEKVLGVNDSVANEDLDKRLDIAAVHSSVRKTMLTQIPNGSPVGKARRSSGFGKRKHPVTKKYKMHRGLDFAVNTGTKIYAPADGVVEVTRKSNQGSGNYLRLQHSFGFSSSYSHLKQFKVRSGQFVRKGDLIGISGNTGLSSGPHLHYEIRFVGRALDPQSFVDWGINEFEGLFEKERGIRWESLIKTVEERVAQQLQLSSPKAALLAESSN